MRVIVPASDPIDGTFTRASSGTYVDETGVVRTSGTNQPRYQDGLLLLESAASNLLQYSEDFRNTTEAGGTRPWAQQISDGDLQVNLVSVVRPDGTTANTSKMALSTTGTLQRQIAQSVAGLSDNAVVVFSVFVKAAEVPRVSLLVSTKAPAYPGAVFDLSTGAVKSTFGTLVASGSTALASGWWRFWVAVNVGTGANTPSVFVQTKNASNADYGGAIGDGFYLWGAQLEIASAPTSYIPRTGTASASRSADSLAGEYLASLASTLVGLPIVLMDEDPSPGWVSGTNYSIGAVVSRSLTHRVYARKVAGAGDTPPEDDPTNWRDLRSTVRWAPLSLAEDTYAVALGNLYFTLKTTQACSGLILGGIRASVVRVVVVASGVAIFDQSYTMPPLSSSSLVGNEPVIAVTLPQNTTANSLVHISLIGAGDFTIAWLRYLAFGQNYTIGGTLQGSRVGIADYSRKETDEFGTTTLVPRSYAKRLTLEMTVPNSEVQATFALLADLRASPAMWVPADGADLSWLATYGWIKEWGITVAYSRVSLCSLEIEGLI